SGTSRTGFVIASATRISVPNSSSLRAASTAPTTAAPPSSAGSTISPARRSSRRNHTGRIKLCRATSVRPRASGDPVSNLVADILQKPLGRYLAALLVLHRLPVDPAADRGEL